MPSNDDFYQRLRVRVREWASNQGPLGPTGEVILLAPDIFHLVCKLLLDTRVPAAAKAQLGVAAAYFVSPIDLIPEGLVGPIGYLDDVAVAAYALHKVLEDAGPAIVREHWAGDGDVIHVIEHVLEVVKSVVKLPFDAIFGKR